MTTTYRAHPACQTPWRGQPAHLLFTTRSARVSFSRRFARRLLVSTGKPCQVVPKTYFGSRVRAKWLRGVDPSWHEPMFSDRSPGWKLNPPVKFYERY